MRNIITNLLALGLLLGSTTVVAVPVIYDWAGQCDRDCVGTSTAVITLSDAYTPGTVLGQADSAFFVSLEYSSSRFSFTLVNADLNATTLAFGFDPSNTTTTQIAGGTLNQAWPAFHSRPSFWFANSITGVQDFSEIPGVFTVRDGDGGSDSDSDDVDVPEPGTFVLLGLGLAGMGFSRRRKIV